MKQIIYFSPNCYYSTDKMILHKLNEKVKLKWYLLWDVKDKKYTIEEVKQYAAQNNIELKIIYKKYRIRDFRNLIFSLKLGKMLKKFNSDCYYFESIFNLVFWFGILLFLPINKVIWAWHDVVPHVGRENLLKEFIQRLIIRIFRNHQVFSDTQKQLFFNHFNYSNKNLFSIPLALHSFGECNETISSENKIAFLFFGSIRENKGLDIVLNAVNQLKSEFKKKIKLIIVGNCSNFNAYRKLIINNEIFELIIKTVPNELIPCIFNRSDYLILPYRDVTQSGPLMIAFNYNVPVITSDHPGFKEYVNHGQNGYIFENENILSLTETLTTAIKKHVSEYDKLVEGVKYTKKNHFDLYDIINKYYDMFTNLNIRTENVRHGHKAK